MNDTYTSGKLNRSHLRTLIDSTFDLTGTADWFLIGKDIEDMSIELNPNTTTIKNILDETSVKDEGYEPSITADPYYANPGDDIYEKVKDIALSRVKGDGCKTRYLEIIIDKTASAAETAGGYDAWQEECLVKPTAYGGSQEGVNIPFSVIPCGNRVKGTAAKNDSTGKWEFTAASSTQSSSSSSSGSGSGGGTG